MSFTPPLHRRTGYCEALQAAGADTGPELEVLGYFTVEGGRAAARTLLDLPNPPTAIFAESDEMACGALREIADRSLRVPEDVSVIGFDDQPIAELMDLSSVRQPVEEQARSITTRLLDLVADPDSPPAQTRTVLPTEVVVRATTGAPPR